VINTASLAAYFPQGPSPLYAITKSGVAVLSRALKLQEQATGVYVSAVCPGFIDTNMGQLIPKELIKQTQGDFIPMEVIVQAFEELALDTHNKGGSVLRVTTQRGIEYEQRLQFIPAKL